MGGRSARHAERQQRSLLSRPACLGDLRRDRHVQGVIFYGVRYFKGYILRGSPTYVRHNELRFPLPPDKTSPRSIGTATCTTYSGAQKASSTCSRRALGRSARIPITSKRRVS